MAIVGPTGVGKSALALQIAEEIGATILSVDSMQVYRGMDIGTAKPTVSERARVPHLMIDVAEPETDYTVAEFQRAARARLAGEGGPVLVVGGSGLHFRAVVDPLEFPPSDPDVRSAVEASTDSELVEELVQSDPAAAGLVDLNNRRRVVRAVEILRLTGETPSTRASQPSAVGVREYRSHLPVEIIGLDRGDDDVFTTRVASRVAAMREAGFMEEVAGLRGRLGRQASQAVGYKELNQAMEGAFDIDDAFARIVDATWSLVKRQRTFFRRDPRIRWFDLGDGAAKAASAIMGAMSSRTRT